MGFRDSAIGDNSAINEGEHPSSESLNGVITRIRDAVFTWARVVVSVFDGSFEGASRIRSGLGPIEAEVIAQVIEEVLGSGSVGLGGGKNW